MSFATILFALDFVLIDQSLKIDYCLIFNFKINIKFEYFSLIYQWIILEMEISVKIFTISYMSSNINLYIYIYDFITTWYINRSGEGRGCDALKLNTLSGWGDVIIICILHWKDSRYYKLAQLVISLRCIRKYVERPHL